MAARGPMARAPGPGTRGADPFASSLPPATATPVPRTIHQTWKTANLPPAWAAARAGCAAMHPGWSHRLWTDADARALIASRFPHVLATYDGYATPVQRADVARYAILAVHGGVYLDMDVVCEKRLDPLLTSNLTLPLTWPSGVSNDVMAAAQGHPFMATLVGHARWAAIGAAWIPSRYARVMLSTGPVYVTLHALFMRDKRAQLRLLPAALYGKYGPRGSRLRGAGVENGALVTHLHGSTWHGGDAAAVAWVGAHRGVAGACVAAGAAAAVASVAAARAVKARRRADRAAAIVDGAKSV